MHEGIQAFRVKIVIRTGDRVGADPRRQAEHIAIACKVLGFAFLHGFEQPGIDHINVGAGLGRPRFECFLIIAQFS
jgi:hypothetical protein